MNKNTNIRNIEEIDKIMTERRTKFNNATKKITEGSNLFGNQEPPKSMEEEENEFMNNFNENYYLENNKKNNSDIDTNLRSFLAEDTNKKNPSLKNKSLELESLIVDSLTRNNFNKANSIFGTLERMYDKFDDEDIRDTYFRVLNAMPKKATQNQEIYSYRQDKNNFKDVLDEMHKKENIKAFNENNQCISSLGLMWEECDRNICSDRCKDRIMRAKEISENEECSRLVTGVKKDNNNKDVNIRMTDDIKDIIIERLRYCKKVAQLQKGNFDVVSYSDQTELKQKMIEEIFKLSRMANVHYSSCATDAADFLETDDKYKEILNLLKTIDLSKLDLEKLQGIRNDLTKLPNCSHLAYQEYEKKRDKNVKDGIKVGKYVIPKNTDYYSQLKGKDKPIIYRDLVTDKQYLYDSFSKTLTSLDYPTNKEEVVGMENDGEVVKLISKNNSESPSASNTMNEYLLKKEDNNNNNKNNISPSPTISNENIGITHKQLNNMALDMYNNNKRNNANKANNNVNEVNEVNEVNNNVNNRSLVFGLKGSNIMEYVVLVLIIIIVVYLASMLFNKLHN